MTDFEVKAAHKDTLDTFTPLYNAFTAKKKE